MKKKRDQLVIISSTFDSSLRKRKQKLSKGYGNFNRNIKLYKLSIVDKIEV